MFLSSVDSGGKRSRHLFDDAYCIVMRTGHPLLKKRLDPATFVSFQHVAISTGIADTLVDRQLSKLRMKRSIKLKVSHYHVAVDVVAGSDLLATVPWMIGSAAKGVRMLPPPMKVTPAEVRMVWHAIVRRDPAIQWLLSALAGLDLHTTIAAAHSSVK
jgi:DNA-binding transcriptional LysR family regulator